MTTDPRVDAYIANAAPFAQPILSHLRDVVREALPQADETIKWGMPHFTVSGKNVAGIAAFKAHCAFVVHGEGRQGGGPIEGMGGYGKIGSLADLPPRSELAAVVRAAADRVAATGRATVPRGKAVPKADIDMPEDFAAALDARPGARDRFAAFPPGARREYLQWIASAKRPDTRARRIAAAADQSAEGKKMNWKYEGC